MKMKPLYLLLTLCILVTCGCEIIDQAVKDAFKSNDQIEREKIKYTIAINKIVKYPRANEIEKEIDTYSRRKIWINKNPYLTSKDIKEIKLIEKKNEPGLYDLNLELDRRGRLVWMALSVEFRNQKLALVIDGICYKLFTPQKITTENDSSVIVAGPVDAVTAEGLKKHSTTNYRYFHRYD